MADIAAGFIGLKDVFARRVSTVGVDVIREAIDVSTAAYNTAFNQMISVLTSDLRDNKVVQERYRYPATATMQPVDEYGRPKVVQENLYYTQAYPLLMSAHAWGANWVSLAKMTVEEANDQLLAALRADADWNIRHILSALFYPAAWTFEDQDFGSLTIYPLALSAEATTKYVTRTGALQVAQMYGAQAAAIDGTHNPFPTIRRNLKQYPQNTGPVIVYIHNDQRASIEALSNFVEVADPDVVSGVSSDRLAGAAPVGHLGDEVVGKVDQCWIVEWERMPSGYMLAHAHGTKVLARRQQPEAELQGLIKRELTEGNLTTYEFYRHAGFAPRVRVGAMVYYIGGASYTAPTGYTSIPLPI